MERLLTIRSSQQQPHRRKPRWLACFGALLLGLTGTAQAQLVSATLPNSRSVSIGEPATLFATMINASSTQQSGCRVAPASPFPGSFSYQQTDPATNVPVGSPNAPVSLAPAAAQSFVLTLTPQVPMDGRLVSFSFRCDALESAEVIAGLNTLELSASEQPTPDVILIAAAEGGVASLGGATGTGAFALASSNVGAAGDVFLDINTATTAMPVNFSWCETDSAGSCITPGGATSEPLRIAMSANSAHTFSVFAGSNDAIAFDPARNRVRAEFRDANGTVLGATSVALEAPEPTATPGSPAKLTRHTVVQFAEALRALTIEGGTAVDELMESIYGNSVPTFNLRNTKDTTDCPFGGTVRVDIDDNGEEVDLRYSNCALEQNLIASGRLNLEITRLISGFNDTTYDATITFLGFRISQNGAFQRRDGTVRVTVREDYGEAFNHLHDMTLNLTVVDSLAGQDLVANNVRLALAHGINGRDRVTVNSAAGRVSLSSLGHVDLRHTSEGNTGTVQLSGASGTDQNVTFSEDAYTIYFKPSGPLAWELSIPTQRLSDLQSFDGANEAPEFSYGAPDRDSNSHRGVFVSDEQPTVIDLGPNIFDADVEFSRIDVSVIEGAADALSIRRLSNSRFELRAKRTAELLLGFVVSDASGASAPMRFTRVTTEIDSDGDGSRDYSDRDDDNDGFPDEDDQFPADPSEWIDTDGDLIGNNRDRDDDGDGVLDAEDGFPLLAECAALTEPGCAQKALANIDLATATPDGRLFLFETNDAGFTRMYVWSTSSEALEGSYIINASAVGDPEETLRAATWHPLDQRLYLGYREDVTWFDFNTETEVPHVSGIPGIERMLPLGAHLFVESWGNFHTYTSTGARAHHHITGALTFRSAWSDAQNRLYNLRVSGGLGYRQIDPQTGRFNGGSSSSSLPNTPAQGIGIAAAPNGRGVVTSPGLIFDEDLDWQAGTDFPIDRVSWTTHSGIVGLTSLNEGTRTVLTRFDDQGQILDQKQWPGKPIALLASDLGNHVLVSNGDELHIELYLAGTDGDGDGVAGIDDAFLLNGAAAQDTDRDRSPDAWIGGAQPADPLGLVLDEFPDHPLCQEATDAPGGVCSNTGGGFEPESAAAMDDRVYFFDAEQSAVFIYNRLTNRWETPIGLGAPALLPVRVNFDGPNRRFFVTYSNNSVAVYPVAPEVRSIRIARMPFPIREVSPLGPQLFITENGSPFDSRVVVSTLLDVSGAVDLRTETRFRGTPGSIIWDEDRNGYFEAFGSSLCFYALTDRARGEPLTCTVENRSLQNHPRPTTLWLSPDGSRLLDDLGWLFDAATLTVERVLNVDAIDTLWLPDGRFLVLEQRDSDTVGSRIRVFDAGGTRTTTLSHPGTPIALFMDTDGPVLVHQTAAAPEFTPLSPP